jgi:hypothetical protein
MPDNPQQLKHAIDTGRTGDKIDQGYDPGLSPLGTDDEAAGHPATPAQVRMACRLEIKGAPSQPAEQGDRNSKPGLPAVWLIVGAVIVVVIAIVLAAWMR